ncbi:inositol hexakisphosphate and diphosphoinositol-pentakisphosphate kinase 2-like isoform X19 [Lineus longissimus]|uniref:inositol hexakisphosphate and diphosphoinositol-pentakisphosphate kinase 2-like isoform X19 n=1 Tax=Lineus longissimus TaxID=88925 RepID=UPI00315CDE87
MSDGYSQPSPHRVDSGGRASFFLGGEQFSSEYQGFPKASQMAAETGLPTFSCVSEVDIPDVDDDDRRMISVGICAMGKKSKSQPMQEILDRLDRFEYIKTIIFAEETIMNEPVENWPICDCLISFYSKGFCLDKAIQYEKLRRPFSLNDLPLQYDIQDRRAVYKILKENDIDHPRFAILDRESGEKKVRLDHWSDHQVIEGDDQIEVNSIIFQKPFVEKPVSAEDHNVFIYFPTSAGGGSQRLFRKIGSRSSVYSPVSRIRKAGSYIYEDFMPTDGTDVKVYTLGPDYAHAEARKSPALDGKVERDKNGKEVRYPVILNAAEKLMARKVCLAFKQTVCGFDLLRASGKSYVCDVNGFSFVKNSAKYYDDSAKILGNMIMRRLAPQLSIPWSIAFQPEDIPIVPTTYGTMMELRCVIAVIRHGDRTPKQKMKMEVKHKKFFDLFEKYHGYETGHLKLKRPKQLQEVLDISRFLLAEFNTNHNPEIEEKKSKLEQLKSVLEMYGHFSGINRKVQLKYQPNGRPKRSSSEEGIEFWEKVALDDNYSGTDSSSDAPREPSLVLILKWGGELTPAGKVQAEELGKAFRCMYPGGEGDYGQCPGLGLLRLHSTFRHDLKIYASDEGRVQMTAAAFAKGLLDLEGELTPILVQMVKVGNLNKMLDSATTASVSACPTPSPANSVNSDKGLLALEGELTPILVQMVKSANTNGLLDNDNQCLSKYQNITVTSEGGLRAKEKLRDVFHQNREFTDEDYEKLAPTASSSLINAMKFIQNPFRMCHRVYEIIGKLTKRIKGLKQDPVSKEMKLYHGETWELMMRRWGKLEKDFKQKNDRFDISKIPDIYDCIKYDLQHNQTVLQFEQANELHTCSKALADIIVPQEYGITKDEKIQIAQSICTPLLKKIKCDLERNTEEESTRLDARYSKGVSTPHRHVRTRLYFTSESHIHSLLTLIKHGELCDERYDKQWQRAMDYVAAISELNYMTQIVIMMYEDPTKEPTSEERFHVELHFSPGAQTCETDMNYPILCGYRSQLVKKNKEHVDSEDGGSSRRKSSSPVTIQQVKSKTRHKSEENLSLSETGSPRSHSFEEKHSCSFEETGSETVADRRKKAAKTKRRVHKRAMSAGLPNAASYPNIARVNHKLALSFYASQKGSTDPDAASTDTNSVAQKHPDITRVNQQLALNTSLNNRRNSLASAPTTLDLLYLPGQMHVRHSFATLFAQTLSDVGKGARGGLISTKVISGSASAPDLMEVDRVKLRAGQGLETRVPAIRPLETLHNSLTLKQVEAFVDNLIAKTPPTPPLHSGHHSSTSSTPRSKTKPSSTIPVTAYSYSSSTSSSAGPSSPTSVSTPEDIAIKLRLLMDSAAGPIVSLDDVSFYSPASSVSSTPTTPASSQSLSSASSSQNFSLNKS